MSEFVIMADKMVGSCKGTVQEVEDVVEAAITIITDLRGELDATERSLGTALIDFREVLASRERLRAVVVRVQKAYGLRVIGGTYSADLEPYKEATCQKN